MKMRTKAQDWAATRNFLNVRLRAAKHACLGTMREVKVMLPEEKEALQKAAIIIEQVLEHWKDRNAASKFNFLEGDHISDAK